MKENQHFLPQHYLRQFRIGNSKLIGIAKVDPFRFIGAGPIRGQCQKQSYYSDSPGADKLLGSTETDLAPVVADVIKHGDFNSPQLIALRLLAVILHVRTKKAMETAKVFPKYIAYEVIKHGIETGRLPPPPGGRWTENMMDFDGLAGALIKEAVVPCWMEMQTLQLKRLHAPVGTPFITSDHPVVTLNEFCSRTKSPRSFAGFSLTGFQLVLPLSPTLCLFFFDQKVYKVGARSSRIVNLSASDAEIVNALQVQTADECIYFHDLSISNTKSGSGLKDMPACGGRFAMRFDIIAKVTPNSFCIFGLLPDGCRHLGRSADIVTELNQKLEVGAIPLGAPLLID